MDPTGHEDRDENPTRKEKGCYQCGSEEGTLLALCPTCLKENESQRLKLINRISVDSSGVEDPFVYKVTNLDNANWMVVSALFGTLLVGAFLTTFIAGIAFSVTFLLFTAALSLGVVVVAQIALVREAYAIAPWLGVVCTVLFPLTPFLSLIPRTKFPDPAILVSIKTTVGALIAGSILLTSSFLAANLIGVQILKPATYWRIAAKFEDTSNKPIVAPITRHFE